jgi:hypothetical protein
MTTLFEILTLAHPDNLAASLVAIAFVHGLLIEPIYRQIDRTAPPVRGHSIDGRGYKRDQAANEGAT